MAITSFPIETTNPKVEVTLPVGQHVLELIVVDSAGLRSAPATVVITVQKAEEVSITIDPPSASLIRGTKQQFTAKVSGTANTAVTWTVKEGPSGGTIDDQGLYTAPAAYGNYTVVATSAADPAKSASAKIVVHEISPCTGANPKELCPGATPKVLCTGATPNVLCTGATPNIHLCTSGQPATPSEVSMSISPESISLSRGQEQQFTATVKGASDTAVTWKAEIGSIDATGLYTATTSGSDKVTATSVADPSKSATATVTVAEPSLCAGATPKILCTVATPAILCTAAKPMIECVAGTPGISECTAALPKIIATPITDISTPSIEKPVIPSKAKEAPTVKPKGTTTARPKQKPKK